MLKVSGEMGGSAYDGSFRARRVEILLAWGRLDEAAANSGPYPQVAELRAAQGRHHEAEESWRRGLDEFVGTDDRLERAETMVGYARFLAGRGRTEEARATLGEARDLVKDTGAKFHERLIREAEALLE